MFKKTAQLVRDGFPNNGSVQSFSARVIQNVCDIICNRLLHKFEVKQHLGGKALAVVCIITGIASVSENYSSLN